MTVALVESNTLPVAQPSAPTCEQCEQPFTRRAAGKPQRFCSVDCRRAYHDRQPRPGRGSAKRGNAGTFETAGEAECLLNPPAESGAFIDHRPNGGPLLHIPESTLKHVDRIGREMAAEDALKDAVTRMAAAGATVEQTAIFEDAMRERMAGTQISIPAEFEFDWLTAEEVCISEQQGIAVYEAKDGDIVIRQQRAWCDDEDSMIWVKPDNLMKLIDKLCDLAGVGSAGR